MHYSMNRLKMPPTAGRILGNQYLLLNFLQNSTNLPPVKNLGGLHNLWLFW